MIQRATKLPIITLMNKKKIPTLQPKTIPIIKLKNTKPMKHNTPAKLATKKNRKKTLLKTFLNP